MLLANSLGLLYSNGSVGVTRLIVPLAVPNLKPLAISRPWMNWVVLFLPWPGWNSLCSNGTVLQLGKHDSCFPRDADSDTGSSWEGGKHATVETLAEFSPKVSNLVWMGDSTLRRSST